jgi:serine/threonine protein phosphatase PrpC
LYQDKPDSVPLSETHKEVETKLGPVMVTCDYGGPHSKYDKENQDSFVFGNTQNGSIFIAVIDGAGGSGGGLEASIKANLDLGINLTNGLSPLDALSLHIVCCRILMSKKKFRHMRRGCRLNESRDSIYATGVALQVEKSGRVLLASSGDSKIATIRNGAILREGTTQMQNIPSRRIEQSLLDSKEYYCHFAKSTITVDLE